jgi:site-specific DNA-cytosine methylase
MARKRIAGVIGPSGYVCRGADGTELPDTGLAVEYSSFDHRHVTSPAINEPMGPMRKVQTMMRHSMLSVVERYFQHDNPERTLHYAVRRLTPIEHERLQGFPDDWTNVPFDGRKNLDRAREEALGNSMAVPVMKWIGQRIAAVA